MVNEKFHNKYSKVVLFRKNFFAVFFLKMFKKVKRANINRKSGNEK